MSLIVKEYNKKQINRMAPEIQAEKIKQMRKEHDKMVKGRFEFVDAQGGWLDFAYRIFKDSPIISMKLVHGETYDLPAGIVRHLNNTKKKIRKMVINLDGNARGVSSTFEIQSRVNFIPVDAV
jgi:hypothetical protein